MKEENAFSLQEKVRARLLVKGVVQGVGFRPFVDRYALENHLAGWVLNSSSGVEIEVEGRREDVEKFVGGFSENAPPRSLITRMDVSYCPPFGYAGFTIRQSIVQPWEFTLISPDLALCPDCLKELRDPEDRRYGYPFINCTNCGPRYTIIRDIPYDRSNTTMNKFTMCSACEKEYEDPADRRFHAQPNACWDCGPKIWLSDLNGVQCSGVQCSGNVIAVEAKNIAAETKNAIAGAKNVIAEEKNAIAEARDAIAEEKNAIAEAKNLLRQGKILAIKGLGGFHLACDARNEEAVRTLRMRKKREEKPFALMVKSIENIRSFCFMCEEEEQSLLSARAPILLLKKKNDSFIAPSVAPKSQRFGVMLPYTPLHHLIMDGDYLALVMTSGNISQEPIVISNEEAATRLRGIADFFLFHDRDIYTRSDDSIVQVMEGKEALLRRSRGYCPMPIHLGPIHLFPPSLSPLPPQGFPDQGRGDNQELFDPGLIHSRPPGPIHLGYPGQGQSQGQGQGKGKGRSQEILACGAELKNTICLTREEDAFVSQYLGDLENLETFRFFEHTVSKMKRILKVDPKIIAYDLHPDYLSTKYAQEACGFDLAVPVQHHHAHIASCMAENGLKEKVIGIAWDGTGYGEDGCIWGGEFLVSDFVSFERKAFFSYVPLPGGQMAIKEPYRMALCYLYQVFGEKMMDLDLAFLRPIGQGKQAAIMEVMQKRINSPLTSSAGRLFESISALLGVRSRNTFEGQAAMDLEYLASSFQPWDDEGGETWNPGENERQGYYPHPYPYVIHCRGSHYQIEVTPMIEQIVHEIVDQQRHHHHHHQDPAEIAFRFHLTMAEIAAEVCCKIREEYGIKKVVLSGGVFQNRLLTSLLSKKLLDREFDCYKHWKVPSNDGGISLGQAVIAHYKS